MKSHLLSALTCAGFLLLNFNNKPALACWCVYPPPSPRQELKQSIAVFAGKVVDFRVQRSSQGYLERRVKFSVSKVWKGVSRKTVVVITGFGEGDCGCPFVKKGEYLLYARAREGQKLLYTDVCMRTARLAAAKKDLQALGKGRTLP